MKMSEHVGICRNMLDYVGLCRNMSEYVECLTFSFKKKFTGGTLVFFNKNPKNPRCE